MLMDMEELRKSILHALRQDHGHHQVERCRTCERRTDMLIHVVEMAVLQSPAKHAHEVIVDDLCDTIMDARLIDRRVDGRVVSQLVGVAKALQQWEDRHL